MDMQIWHGILDTDRMYRYFHKLEDKYRKQHQLITFLLVVFTMASMASLVAELPYPISAVGMFVSGSLSAWLYQMDYSGRTVAAGIFSTQYQVLSVEWKHLWYGARTEVKVNTLQLRQSQVATGFYLPFDEKLNGRCAEQTYAIIPKEFAIG